MFSVKFGAAMLGALLALFPWTREANATTWQAYNNCWADFDVGGEWFCGLRTSACSVPGLYCKQTVGTELPAPYSASAPAAKAIALDNIGNVWLVGTDNRLHHELPGRTWTQFSPAVPMSCVRKVAVSGAAGVNPRILALGCSGAVYRYLDGAWIQQLASGGVDVSVTSGGTLTYLRNTHRLYFSGAGGGGVISGLAKSTRVTETWIGGSFVHTTTLLAGYTGAFGNEFFFCNNPANGIAGTAAFYSFSSNRFVTGDPAGCDHLRLPSNSFDPQGSPFVLKVVAGNRGPGSDLLWILTNFTRVYALQR